MFVDLNSGLLGGGLIALASGLHLFWTGRLSGLSGIASSLVQGGNALRGWKPLYLSGMMVGAIGAAALLPENVTVPEDHEVANWAGAIIGGALVGFGTRLGSGCTSGHGINGISRFSLRSIVATATFMTLGIVTATGLSSLGLFRTLPGPSDFASPVLQWLGIAAAALLLVKPYVAGDAAKMDPVHNIVTVLSGGLFGAGLVVSTMPRPDRILGFLNLTDLAKWDATLLVVFMTGLTGATIIYQSLFKWVKHPMTSPSGLVGGDKEFDLPTKREITKELVIGSMLFGMGWGTCGLCPGPVIDVVALGIPKYWALGASMLSGMYLHRITFA